MDSLTGRERILMAIRHETPDRTPIGEQGVAANVREAFFGRTALTEAEQQALSWEESIARRVENEIELKSWLGHDLVLVSPNPTPEQYEKSKNSPPPSRFSDDLSLFEAGEVERRISNFEVNVEKEEQDDRPLEDSSFGLIERMRNRLRERGLDLAFYAQAIAVGIWNDATLLVCFALRPDLVRRRFEARTRRVIKTIKRFGQLGVDIVVMGGDFACRKGPMVSPQQYRELMLPYLRRLSDACHESGCWPFNASDGNLWPVIDDFLIGADVDGMVEIEEPAGMDLGRLKERFGDRICFMGNLDCGELLVRGTPEQIRAATVKCLEQGSGNGGHILSTSNCVQAGTPPENYRAMLDAYREHFGLPKLA